MIDRHPADQKTQKGPIMPKTKELPAIEELEEVEVEAETFSAKDLAKELGIDAKSFRRWLRAHTEDRANKGGRWVFTADSKAEFLEAYRTKHTEGTEPELSE